MNHSRDPLLPPFYPMWWAHTKKKCVNENKNLFDKCKTLQPSFTLLFPHVLSFPQEKCTLMEKKILLLNMNHSRDPLLPMGYPGLRAHTKKNWINIMSWVRVHVIAPSHIWMKHGRCPTIHECANPYVNETCRIWMRVAFISFIYDLAHSYQVICIIDLSCIMTRLLRIWFGAFMSAYPDWWHVVLTHTHTLVQSCHQSVCCSLLQCAAVCCRVLQCVALSLSDTLGYPDWWHDCYSRFFVIHIWLGAFISYMRHMRHVRYDIRFICFVYETCRICKRHVMSQTTHGCAKTYTNKTCRIWMRHVIRIIHIWHGAFIQGGEDS